MKSSRRISPGWTGEINFFEMDLDLGIIVAPILMVVGVQRHGKRKDLEDRGRKVAV